MLNILQAQTVTLDVGPLDPSANFYIWNFIDFNFQELIVSLVDQSPSPERYSEFLFTDGSDGTIIASGNYYIWGSSVDASVIDASMNLLEEGKYTYYRISEEDVVWDPSLMTYSGVDYVFDPVFNTTTPLPTSFDHDLLLNRDSQSNHPWALPEASLGAQFYWVDGSLFVIDVSGTNYDASISELRYYVDGSLNSLWEDSSTQQFEIDNLYDFTLVLQNSIATNDASIVIINDYQIIQDNSIAAKQDIIPDGTFLKESSLGTDFEWSAGYLDVSVSSVTTLEALTDTSISNIQSNDILQYDPSGTAPNLWKNQPPADATQWFYTKSEIDAMFALITGGGI